MPNFEIRATADVGQATAGLGKLQAELGKTAATAAKSDAAISKAANGIGKTLPSGANQATNALTNLGRVVQDAPFGFIGIANNINPLIESFQRLQEEAGSSKAAFSALASGLLGAGGLGFAVSVVTSLLTAFTMDAISASGSAKSLSAGLEPLANKIKETKKAEDDFKDATLDASTAVLQQTENLLALKNIYTSLAPEIDNVTASVIRQGTAQFLFDKKNTEIQKLLSQEIQREIDLRKKQRPFSGVQEYSSDLFSKDKLTRDIAETKDKIRQINDLSFGLEDAFKNLFSRAAGVKPVRVEPIQIERQLPSLFPPGKVVSVPKEFSPKLVLTPSIQINRGIDSQLFTLGLFKAFLNEQALKDFQEKATTAINQTFANIINDSISTFADTIGKTLAGQGSFLPNLFEGLIKGIGDQVKELGKTLVRYGVQMIIARKAIEKLAIRPEVAVIAGFALQILGSTLAAAANKKFGSAKFATGVRNFEGGIATVGERGPETVLLPRGSSVVPNNEVMAYGGGGITLMPSIAYDGTQFRIFLNRVDAKLSRTG